eukprot:ANDGO_05341.mRNA.1 Intraflagellar transport protein 56
MLLSRSKQKDASAMQNAASQREAAKKKKTNLETYIQQRDYTGAIALLEFQRQTGQQDDKYPTLPWLAYAAFHIGDYQKAASIYKELLDSPELASSSHMNPGLIAVYLGCSLFYLGDFANAQKAVLKSPDSPLKNRLLFHIAHRQNDENALMTYHQRLQNTVEDQLCLAAVHYLRNHFQEATEIYKKILLENRDFLALNVYIALCYYKLDYYDVALEVLNVYLQSYPDSGIALNLKACINYRLYNGKAAEQELKVLMDLENEAYNYQNELVQHNLVVFRGGVNALQVFPKLMHAVPEARLNLCIHYLKNAEFEEAYELMKDVEPSAPQEYILKGVVNACVGQRKDSQTHLKMAQQYFQIVGSSASECDTIPGRQCMASCFFLLKQFDDVLIYLRSIKTYFYAENDFLWNYGIALVQTRNFKEAEEVLLTVTSDEYKNEFAYVSHLARAYIANGKPKQAWELYLKLETSADSFQLLQLISNDCYAAKSFFYSAKAFDVLERLDPAPEYWEGKRGACCGAFQQVVQQVTGANGKVVPQKAADKSVRESLRDIINLLVNTRKPQAERIAAVMKRWCTENGVSF